GREPGGKDSAGQSLVIVSSPGSPPEGAAADVEGVSGDPQGRSKVTRGLTGSLCPVPVVVRLRSETRSTPVKPVETGSHPNVWPILNHPRDHSLPGLRRSVSKLDVGGSTPVARSLPGAVDIAFLPLTRTQASVLPVGRYKTKDVAGDRHPADGRERQVSGHKGLAGRRQLPQETDPDADRLLRVVVESVVPVGA